MIRLVSDKKHVIRTNEEVRLERELADQQVVTARVEVNEAKKLIERLEKEVLFYRVRYDESLERADRQLDGILRQTGMPEVTATTEKKRKQQEEKNIEAEKQQDKELREMFADSMDEMQNYDSLGLPIELREEAAKMIAGKK